MALTSKQQILDWVAEHPDAASKRDIGKAFAVKGAEKIELKRLPFDSCVGYFHV